MTPQQRRERLAADFQQMRAIRGGIVQWEPVGGKEPYFECYQLTVRVRTIVGPRPDYANETRLKVELPPGYPFNAAPQTTALSRPFPFHPNWFTGGLWCYGQWAPLEGLGTHVIRTVRILQFDPTIANLNSPANLQAVEWWHAGMARGWFPSDRSVLPDPTASPKITIKEVSKPKIKIRPLN